MLLCGEGPKSHLPKGARALQQDPYGFALSGGIFPIGYGLRSSPQSTYVSTPGRQEARKPGSQVSGHTQVDFDFYTRTSFSKMSGNSSLA